MDCFITEPTENNHYSIQTLDIHHLRKLHIICENNGTITFLRKENFEGEHFYYQINSFHLSIT